MKEKEFRREIYEMAGEGLRGRQMADFIIRRAKDAGATFDPEEEPLPERLELRSTTLRDASDGRFIYGVPAGPDGRILTEMVRRYNIWKAVREEAENGLSYLRNVAGEVGEACYMGSKFRNILSLMSGMTRRHTEGVEGGEAYSE